MTNITQNPRNQNNVPQNNLAWDSAIRQAVDFAEAGFGPYRNIAEALALNLNVNFDVAVELMAEEVAARAAAK